MSPTPDRIRTMRHVTAMVAVDTIDLLAERITNLLAHGRHITIARRYTYVDSPPDLYVGLTVDGEPALRHHSRPLGASFGVHLKPGIRGFGFSAYRDDARTEADAWKAYHAAEGLSDDPFRRRRDMTYVEINGGLPGDGPARDDQLTIRFWNEHGVCDEQVIGFDYDTGPAAEKARQEEAEYDEEFAAVVNMEDR